MLLHFPRSVKRAVKRAWEIKLHGTGINQRQLGPYRRGSRRRSPSVPPCGAPLAAGSASSQRPAGGPSGGTATGGRRRSRRRPFRGWVRRRRREKAPSWRSGARAEARGREERRRRRRPCLISCVELESWRRNAVGRKFTRQPHTADPASRQRRWPRRKRVNAVAGPLQCWTLPKLLFPSHGTKNEF